MHKIAIVIPAYKSAYFEETLQSIENQTCKEFHLYIGDDNSPENLYEIVKNTLKTVNYTYKKFESNLGQKDLVGQWERCIGLTRDEEWIWLFSDDDLMAQSVIEYFRIYLETTIDTAQLVVLNKVYEVGTINISSNFSYVSLDFEEYIKLIKDQSISMPEFIVKRILLKEFGIINFKMAWNSDLATWINIGIHANKIIYLECANLYWRKSKSQISHDANYCESKHEANLDFVIWFIIYLSSLDSKHRAVLIEHFDSLLHRKIFLVRNKITLFRFLTLNLKIYNFLQTLSHLFYFIRNKYF